VGHGGIEAILFSGLVMVNNVVLSVMINQGTMETIALMLGGTGSERMNVLINMLTQTSPFCF
jgi:uncharacterized membrane protein YhfC